LIIFNSGAHDPLFRQKLKIETDDSDDKINRYKKGGLMAAKMHVDLGSGAQTKRPLALQTRSHQKQNHSWSTLAKIKTMTMLTSMPQGI